MMLINKTFNAPVDAETHEYNLTRLSLAALGVVFGDIGTSPLYAIRECFHGTYGLAADQANILGVLSLIFWTLVMVVTFKYITFVLKADNQGEGGVMALTALIRQGEEKTLNRRWGLAAAGIFGACLLYGDGMITPAISVLSAVECIGIITPFFKPYIIALTVMILAGLFLLQRRGTAWVGSLFGPIILVWFCTIAILGLVQIVQMPMVFKALSPLYGFVFLIHNKVHGFVVLGAIFLVVTGSEALYADMGHFGTKPIRMTWAGLVFPALLLNYFGQGALLLSQPRQVDHPFYALVPSWALGPMVILSTLATIIASQALITGAFSLTRQAIQLGVLPRMPVIHTSAHFMGQIYMAPVNWFLMVCSIGLVIGFQSSSKLAAAYGIAVASTMLITTLLFYTILRTRLKWGRLTAGLLTGVFLSMDLPFFFANMSKLFHGAWFPLAIGAVLFVAMHTWEQGRSILAAQLRMLTMPLATFKKDLETLSFQKIRGHAIFLTGNPDIVPMALIQNLTHNKVLHAETAVLYYKTENVPRVPNKQKVSIEKISTGFFRIIVHQGFMEEFKIEKILTLAKEKGLEFTVENTSFFLGREKLSVSETPKMGKWRSNLFIFLSRNSMDAASFYGIPPKRVIEVGVQLNL